MCSSDLFGNFYALNTTFLLPSASSSEGVLSRSQSCKRDGTDSPTSSSHADSSSSSSTARISPGTQTAVPPVTAEAANPSSRSSSSGSSGCPRGDGDSISSSIMSSSQDAASGSSSVHKTTMPAASLASPLGQATHPRSIASPGSLQRGGAPFLDSLREKSNLDLKRLAEFYAAVHAAGRSSASELVMLGSF